MDRTLDVVSQLLRSSFTTDKEHLSPVDFNSIEAVNLAWFCGETWVLDVFRSQKGIYEATAERMFNLPPGSVKKGSPERTRGKIATLALGYQGSIGALKSMGALEMGIPEEELPKIVSDWRNANPNIVAAWYKVQDLAMAAVTRKEPQYYRIKPDQEPILKFHCSPDGSFLFIQLPSGRNLSYYKPKVAFGEFHKPELTYTGVGEVKTYGGKLVENIVQAISRDCLGEAMLTLDEMGYEICGHVHDEIIVETDSEETLQVMERVLSKELEWAKDLPLTAEGFLTKYYRKG